MDGDTVTTPLAKWRFQHDDHLRSACVETNAAGTVISYEEFHAFGTTAYSAHTAALEERPKRYRYSGKERDEESGLLYYGARYLAPWMGRWLSPDPAGTVDGVNLYGFCRGNPVKYGDVGGRFAIAFYQTAAANAGLRESAYGQYSVGTATPRVAPQAAAMDEPEGAAYSWSEEEYTAPAPSWTVVDDVERARQDNAGVMARVGSAAVGVAEFGYETGQMARSALNPTTLLTDNLFGDWASRAYEGALNDIGVLPAERELGREGVGPVLAAAAPPAASIARALPAIGRSALLSLRLRLAPVGGRATASQVPGLADDVAGVARITDQVGTGAGELLTHNSRMAFRAADDIAAWTPKNSHLLSGGSQSKAKFVTDSYEEVQALVQQALRSPDARFLPNPKQPGTFQVVTDLGIQVGIKGQQAIRVVVGPDGRVINAFPVHTR